MTYKIAVLGVFAADTTYRAERQPRMGETMLGNDFKLGLGGKGSNQSVAIAMLGGDAYFISRLGCDQFAAMAHDTWEKAGVIPEIIEEPESHTGTAYIFVDEKSGDNAIIVCPGSANRISTSDIEAKSDLVSKSKVFVTQLEQPLDSAKRALEIARRGGSTKILDPAPAAAIDRAILSLCDFKTPNETEAGELSGVRTNDVNGAEEASNALLEYGCGAVTITLGENAAFLNQGGQRKHVNAHNASEVVETTCEGDAFNGGLAYALANDQEMEEAIRFGCATALISVARPGTAASMPKLKEVEHLLR